ncbi:ABC transporter substrate-binding protein [Kushneria aurantia]|uniref:ABC transporter substrate-binding protein n=1 Tax=Kushneria aurantia TaxID=504092 RepID=A0ABV6G2G4_9GAMM|nr:ABC transporter substrate-binding protein [Kushneria aurantia]
MRNAKLAGAFSFTFLTAGLTLAAPAQAQMDSVHFGSSPWPGVTVKTEVAVQLLEAMGYDTQRTELALSAIMQSLADGDLDVYLAGWYPNQATMVDPLVEQGRLEKLVVNVPDALSGLVVPAYVWNDGIHSLDDLVANGDRFDHTIYGIEAGAAMSDTIDQAISNDYAGLGDWQQQNSNTAAMLSQAGNMIENQQPVVFYGWRPHWMNLAFDLRYLEDSRPDSQIAGVEAQVWTLANPGMAEADPNVHRFFDQFVLDSEIQSEWIFAYSYEERDAADVAHDWIADNRDVVEGWLEGVTDHDGNPAMQRIESAFYN